MTFVSWTSKQHLQPSSIVAKFSPFGEKKSTAQKPGGQSRGFLAKRRGGWNIHTTLGRSTFSLVPILSGMTGCIPRWRFKTKWHSCWWKESQTTTCWMYTKIIKIIEKLPTSTGDRRISEPSTLVVSQYVKLKNQRYTQSLRDLVFWCGKSQLKTAVFKDWLFRKYQLPPLINLSLRRRATFEAILS